MQTTITKGAAIGAVGFSENKIKNASMGLAIDPTVPVAQPGTLTTRGSVSAGTATMTNSGHGIVTGQRADIYWSGGRRRGVVIGTVAGTSVPFTGGAGTDLPATSTALVIATPVKRLMAFNGDDLDLIQCFAPAGNHALIVFVDGSNAELWWRHNQGGIVQQWYTELDDTNPLAGDVIAAVYVSHDNPTTAQAINVGYMVN